LTSSKKIWRTLRLTEQWTATAKSVIQFDVQRQVANSAHAGLPCLRLIRQKCSDRVHFWPFDGWEIPARFKIPKWLRVRTNSFAWMRYGSATLKLHS
jgi:hypothetical protein